MQVTINSYPVDLNRDYSAQQTSEILGIHVKEVYSWRYWAKPPIPFTYLHGYWHMEFRGADILAHAATYMQNRHYPGAPPKRQKSTCPFCGSTHK